MSFLPQVVFALDLAAVWHEAALARSLARVCIADDGYLVAPGGDVVAQWPGVAGALARQGHEARPNTCKGWLVGFGAGGDLLIEAKTF